jgi:biopolymer transport protein TolQ
MGGTAELLRILLHASLIVKLIVIGLVALSILSWAIVLKKRKFWNSLEIDNDKFQTAYTQGNSLKDILAVAIELPGSPLACMFHKGYDELVKIYDRIGKDKLKGELHLHFVRLAPGLVDRAVKQEASKYNSDFELYQPLLASIGSISPFIGLLGTVIGIINSFTGISSGGTSIEAVAPGIAEALIATAIGLFAAIPAVYFYNHFNHESEQMNLEMEAFRQDFLNKVELSLITGE